MSQSRSSKLISSGKTKRNSLKKMRGSRSVILESYMRRRINNTSLKYLNELSPDVQEHLDLLDFNTLSRRLTQMNIDLTSGEYPAIFVAKGHTVSPDKWESHIDAAMLKANDGLAEFIESTLDLYNTKNRKYGYNDLPYRLFRVAELYESTDADVTQRLEKYKAGVAKYLKLMKTDDSVRKDLEDWGLDKIKAKMDNPDLGCTAKFTKTGVCPIDFYYGIYDIPKKIKDIDLSNYQMESVIDYLLNDADNKSCYKHNHLRQYVIGNYLNYTKNTESINKYFHPEPSSFKMRSKYPEITWDPAMNDVYINCLLEHTFNQLNMPLFPIRIYIDDRYINMLENPNVSRYDYVTKQQLEPMVYLGCFLIPVYSYFFEVAGVRHYIEASTRINGSTNIEAEFRSDITTNSKNSYNESVYIKKINAMLDSLMKGKPDDIIKIELNNTNNENVNKLPKHSNTYNIKRHAIRRTVMVYNFHLFNRDKSYIMINSRSNRITPGFMFEWYKFLYREIIQMYYILKHKYKLPSLRLHRYMNTNMFFFSPYYDDLNSKNSFEQKKQELLTLLKKKGDIHIQENNINVTLESLITFYDNLKPYDVNIDIKRGRSLYIEPVSNLRGGSINKRKHKLYYTVTRKNMNYGNI